MEKLFIIDLMPFLYKGHFVFLRNPRMTASGINTSALLGLVAGLQSILKREKPTHAVLAVTLIHISEPTKPDYISYAVFCLKKQTNYNVATLGTCD